MRDMVVVELETTAFTQDLAQLRELTGSEDFNKPFDFVVHLHTKDTAGLDEQSILTNPASLVFKLGDQEQRRIYGVVSEVKDSLHTEGEHLIYRLRFVPRVWKMSQIRRSQVFVDQSIPDILKAKLGQAGFQIGDDFELRLSKTYVPRDLVVQYEESDLQFMTRLTEHLGIAYSFEHQTGRDVLVFSDDNSAFKDIEGTPTLPFRKRGDHVGVFAIEGTTRALPSTYNVKDYNYRTPSVALMKSATIQEGSLGDVIEYGAHFRTSDEAQDIANVRAQEAFATRRIFEGESRAPQLRTGSKFTLDGHPRAEPKLLVTRVKHHSRQTTFNRGTGEEDFYQNEFTAIPQATTYRPPRVTPKPKVHGAITGIIEAESPGQYAELDNDGRYHVRFMLDVGDAPRGKASSLLRMAQPHAGPGYGFHFPLRDGVEVILTCIDGDPDRPIISGAVPNPITPSTVGAGNAQRNVIKTGGGTELNIDDTDGSSRFKVTVPHKNTTFQLGAPNAPGDGVWASTDGNAVVDAKGWINITCDSFMSLSSDSKIDISANGGNITNTAHAGIINVAQGGPISHTASTNVVLTAQGGVILATATGKIDMDSDAQLLGHAPVVGFKADAVATMEAGAGIVLKAGATAELTANIVYVHGVTVTISGTGSVTITGATVNVTAPTVNVTGSGSVNVTGGKINLNC